ncbi:hypothetical protein [Filimonas effusa]|uniref:Uncharacterized protein n=1 Tax=Filimonas effusa TaxID=2508721 RepID=A0A4Q1D2Z0_9BACT|nr:hypothetical protein [Filimonas effusa]RXK81659.1 hypothetical protein ESB13_17825 [Filimonas effusa]
MDNVQNDFENNVGQNFAVLTDTVRIRQLPETVLDTLQEQMATRRPEIKTFGMAGFDDSPTIISIEATFNLIDDTYYYNRALAMVSKEIDIHHEKIGDLNTADLEARLANPPSQDFVTPENSHEYNIAFAAYQSEITKDLLIVQQEKPEIFNRLMVKYGPDVDIQMDKATLERQAKIDADHNKSFEFSDYFKLTTLEMYNLLEDGNRNEERRAVYKTLKRYDYVDSEGNIVEGNNLKDRQDLKRVPSKFDTWLRMKEQPDGSLGIEFVGGLRNVESKLKGFNFLNMDDDQYVNRLAYHIRKGSEVIVQFRNASGVSELLVSANPPEGLKIKNMDGKVLSPVPFLKVQPERKNLSRPVVLSTNERQQKYAQSNHTAGPNTPANGQQPIAAQNNDGGNQNTQNAHQGVMQQFRSFFGRNREVGEDNNKNGKRR